MSAWLARAGAVWAAKQEFDSAKEGYYQLSNYYKSRQPTNFRFDRRRMRIRGALRRRPRRPIYSRRRVYRRRRRLAATLVSPRSSRKRAREALQHVGDPVGLGTCKRAVTQSEWSNNALGSRAIYWKDITGNLKKTDASHIDAIDRRSRDLLNLRGFKIRYTVTNRITAPLIINIAVVNPNHGTDITATDFFRGYGSTRAEDFSTGLNGGAMCFSPINKDKYNVVKHWKIKLKANDRGAGEFIERSHNNYKCGQLYLKVNRQLRFIGGSDNVETPLLLVYWADNPFAQATDISVADAWRYNFETIAYFKEPGMK